MSRVVAAPRQAAFDSAKKLAEVQPLINPDAQTPGWQPLAAAKSDLERPLTTG